MRARIVFLVRVPAGREEDFLAAYERIRYQVSGGVPGHLRDQVCRSATDPGQWLITSEWRRLADFLAWEATEEHRELVRPMRECMTEARSLRFLIRAETEAGAPVGQSGPTGESGQVGGEASSRSVGESGPVRGSALIGESELVEAPGLVEGEASSGPVGDEPGIPPQAEVKPAVTAVARGSA